MRRLVPVALLLLLAVSVYGQRGGSGQGGRTGQRGGSGTVIPVVNFAGNLKASDKKGLLLEVDGEQTVVFRVNAKTHYFIDGKQVAVNAIMDGAPVEVEAKREMNRELMAVRVVWRKTPVAPPQ